MTLLPAAIVLCSIPSPHRERELSLARLVDFQQYVLLNVGSTHAKERFAVSVCKCIVRTIWLLIETRSPILESTGAITNHLH